MKFSDGQSEFSRVFNFAILCYLRNSKKLDAREKLMFYSIYLSLTKPSPALYRNSLCVLFVELYGCI